MKKLACTILFVFTFLFSNAQVIRVAILDFENISGIPKYDGLGKAMSSMLISDIESNVSPKRLQLVERAQIQKILKEQNFQASSNVNKATAVQAGKILGVKYLLVGDVFILNDQLVINARLANTETGDIVFSKKQEGKVINWLALKTSIAKELATKLAMPFTEPRIIDAIIAPAVLTIYANAIDEKDKGNFEKAETLISTAKEFDPAFGYLDDLRDDVDKLKKQIAEQGKKIETLEKSDTIQNKKLSTLEVSDIKQESKINILENSGGRVVNAKTYEELQLNLSNPLTTYEDRKKLFVQIINTYPDKWGKNGIGGFYDIFQKKFDLNELGLNGCTFLLNDILKSREFISKSNLKFFDKNIYFFLGSALMSAQRKVSWEHDFTEDDYIEFKKVADFITKNAFDNSGEQLFAEFNILSSFNRDLKQFNQLIKKEILSNYKSIFDLIEFSFGTQIILMSDNAIAKNNDAPYYIKTNLLAAQEVIIFLSAKRNDYRKVLDIFRSLNILVSDQNAFHYFYKNNIENETRNKSYFNDIKKIYDYFLIPSFDAQNPYLIDIKDNQTVNEFAEIIPYNEATRRVIIRLDSATRRYTRIMESLRKQNIDDPCRVSSQSSLLIKHSDSIALISDIYVLNNKFDIGSRVELIYNYGTDKLYAYVVGKKITNTSKEFEIIDKNLNKKLNKNQIIKFTRNEKFNFSDLNANNIDEDNQRKFENSRLECEAKKRQEQEQKARLEYFKKQAEEQKQKEELKKLAYKNKIITVFDLFKNKSKDLDSISFNHLIDEEKDGLIGLDSIFSLAFHLIVDDIKNPLSNRNSNPILNAQLSILLNLYFIDQIESRNIYPVTVSNFKNAAIINLAHGYLLVSIKFSIDAFDLATTEYKKVAANFKFGQEFNSITREAMIALDWNDFIAKGLVTKKQIDDFNQKFKILDNF
jgi:TolB-like protein